MREMKVWVVRPSEMEEYECFDPPRTVMPLITEELCGAVNLTAGFFRLKPGDISKNDIHAEEEMYYVVSGRARIVIDHETFLVEPGMVVFIPPDRWHQSTSIGKAELCYFWVSNLFLRDILPYAWQTPVQ